VTPFLSIGNMSIDDLVFADGSTRWRTPGGNSVYAALGMAVWGERPGLLAIYGPDYPIEALTGRIDVSPCRRHRLTLRNWGLYENDGSRTFLFRRETRDWIEFCPDVGDLGAARIGACHIAPLPWARQVAMVRAARDRGAGPITVDVDDRRLAQVPHGDLAMLVREIDAFLPSRQDAEAVFPGASPVEALRRFRAMAPDTAVIGVKLGAEGVIMHRAGEAQMLLLPTAASDVVDATGAGDTFCGGFLVGYARSGDMATAALMGSVSASFAVSAIGTDGLVRANPQDAEARMAALAPQIRYLPL